ncbi:MAG TPA: glycerol-3-phosphate acyltransferase [Acidimicrobiia bacterium]|nr:glycerol-3-phosphate acyltransferase [Acidimicrobiia bacterium]
MNAIAAVGGYLLGSIPTAELLGRLRGVDLRSEGSGNPGTANALRTSGPWLAGAVLGVEAAKGLGAVWLGHVLADETAALAAGLAAVAGNVYNLWYRFEGGKGLGISLGVLAGLWSAVVPLVVVAIVAGMLITRTPGIASLVAIATLVGMSFLWPAAGWPTGGLEPTWRLPALAVGIALIISPKHWRDATLS